MYTFNNASASSLGLRNLSLCLRSRGVDTLTFEHAVNTTTGNPIGPNDAQAFATGSTFFVKDDLGNCIFSGTVKAPVAFGTDGSSGHRYTVEGPWADLQRTTYQQLWATTNALGDTITSSWRPDTVLYLQSGGGHYTTWEQIAEALNFAISQEGIALTVATLPTDPGILPPYTQAARTSVADVINQVLQWHPDVQVYFDYSLCPGGNPIIRFKPRATLTPESIDIGEYPNAELDIRARPDLQVPKVCLKYKRTGTYDDGVNGPVPRIYYLEDCYPSSGSGIAGKDGLTIPVDLEGGKTTLTAQNVITASIDKDDIEWWLPRLDGLNDFLSTIPGATIDNLELAGSTLYSRDFEGTIVADLPRELTGGAILECMSGVRAGYTYVRTFIRFRPEDYVGLSLANKKKVRDYFGTFFYDEDTGELITEDTITYRTFIIRVAATDAITKTYRCLDSYTAGEVPPTGIAELLYNALNAYVEHEGSATLKGTDGEAPLYTMGFRLSFANTQFSTAGALVESVCLRFDKGETEILFGPGEKIDPQDWINLLRPQLKSTAIYSGERDSAEPPSNFASGVLLTPSRIVTSEPPPNPPNERPFKLFCADGTVSVTNGRANGILASIPGAGFTAVSSQTIYLKLIWEPTTEDTGSPYSLDGAIVLSGHVEAHTSEPTTTFPTIHETTGVKTNGTQYIPIGTQTGTGSDCVVENDNISGSIGATFCPPQDYRYWTV